MSKPVLIENSREMKEEVGSLSSGNVKKESFLGIFSRLLHFDTRGVEEKPSSDIKMEGDPTTIYYGVYIPCEIKKGPDEEALHVYRERDRALELVRRYKQARFKTFHSMQAAVAFALRGTDPDMPENSSNLMGEKPYPFKGPSPQDMVALRKAIEAGLLVKVRETIWENPRYLVSSGSTPAILQEGSRYNALHIGAKSLNAEMCDLILTTVGDPQFVQRLYGSDAGDDTCREFASLLVDRYLNTPDKGLNETPLHFASKFGAVEVVDVLTSFPQCNKEAVNKFGETAKDIICNRHPGKQPDAAERILRMLGERYYVPVFHSEDDSRQPTIGNIFTPSTPPEVNVDPLSPRLEIRAFAGPMEAREAQQFRRKWKTPPRVQTTTRAGLVAPPAFRLNEITKGLESVGRNLAGQMKVGWKEYWPFLDTFTDFRTPEGLQLLENYLSNQYNNAYSLIVDNSAVISSHVSPENLSISNIFNSSSPSKEVLSPMSDLCSALKGCSLNSNSKPSKFREGLALSRARRLNLTSNNDVNGEVIPANHMVSQLMCIERTCQVFAKRIADALNVSLTADFDVVEESLKSEAKHLQHTMSSYMDDERFQTIDFGLIHYRLSQLVVLKLLQHTKDNDDIQMVIDFLKSLKSSLDDSIGSDEEKKPSHRYLTRRKVRVEVEMHVQCIAQFISEELSEGGGKESRGPSANQEECSAVWACAQRCACEWDRDSFDRNNRRSASFKRKQRKRSTSPLYVKALFQHDEGEDGAEDVNCDTPSGDPVKTLSINVDKCLVLTSNELISEDDSDKSSPEEEDDCNGYQTASEHDASAMETADDEDEDKMADTSDQAAVETFIYGEEPSKMDRLVYDAVAGVDIAPDQFPQVYRWRHTVALYSPQHRNKWLAHAAPDDSIATPIKGTLRLGTAIASSPIAHSKQTFPEVCSSPISVRTPRKLETSVCGDASQSVPLQVSNWLRVTGPNSPRSALTKKNVGHNVSFGF